MRRVGILGYGKLGRHLATACAERDDLDLRFVWNRTPDVVPAALRVDDLENLPLDTIDLLVEVAHPALTWEHGARWNQAVDLMVGSPTALARPGMLETLGQTHGLFVPRGALPGLEEVQRLTARGMLAEAHITMRKHPRSLKVDGYIPTGAVDTVWDGPLRDLCGRAPNNVNTMAVLALASGLGFDEVHATLVGDPALQHHVTEVRLLGPDTGGPRFELLTRRSSPAGPGAVTSTATLSSFAESLIASTSAGPGLHLR